MIAWLITNRTHNTHEHQDNGNCHGLLFYSKNKLSIDQRTSKIHLRSYSSDHINSQKLVFKSELVSVSFLWLLKVVNCCLILIHDIPAFFWTVEFTTEFWTSERGFSESIHVRGLRAWFIVGAGAEKHALARPHSFI